MRLSFKNKNSAVNPKTNLGASAQLAQNVVRQYEVYVRKITYKIYKSIHSCVDFEDLVAYGMGGLLEAAQRYDARYGVNFSTFSYYRIRGAIYDGLRTMGWLGRAQYQRQRLEATANQFLQSQAETCHESSELKSSPQEQLNALADNTIQLATLYITSLDALAERESEQQYVQPDQCLQIKQMAQALRQSVSKLPLKEQEFIQLYYYQDLTFDEIGQKMGLSKSWISRRHSQISLSLARFFCILSITQHFEKKTEK